MPARIIGVVPIRFQPDVAMWQPFQDVPESFRGSGASVTIRLREGLSIEAAQGSLADDLRTAGTDVLGVKLESLHEETVEGARTTLKTLSAAVAAVLMLACVNVAGLLIARGAGRAVNSP